MKAIIKKVFRFEASHHLPNHDGKCRNVHGHSYRVVVELVGEIDERLDSPKKGMVYDFADISDAWKELCAPHLDHCDLNESLVIPATTAECIATWIALRLRDVGGVPIHAIEVWETETSCAVVHYAEAWASVGVD